METPDAELITRVILSDDRHAFATLVRRHQSRVRGLLRRLTGGDRALADDLAQETFIKVYRSLAAFRGGAKFSTWLHRIAYNVFISHTRGKPAPAHYEQDTAQAADSHNDLHGPALQHDLECAMKELSESERAAVRFCCQCGFSHAEAAEILQQPLGTVKTNVNRGKAKLRRALAAWQEGVV